MDSGGMNIDDESLPSLCVADFVHRIIHQQQNAVERAIEASKAAQTAADMGRKIANDSEKAMQESPVPGSGTIYHEHLQFSLEAIQHVADVLDDHAAIQQQLVEDAIKLAKATKTSVEKMLTHCQTRKRALEEDQGSAMLNLDEY